MTDANAVLNTLTASNIFDLRGVVAVVTGGGTVSARLHVQRSDLTIRFVVHAFQGIGLMISSTLMANGATVYIIGPDQKQLDAIARTYNDAAQGHANRGKIVGLQGDVRSKVGLYTTYRLAHALIIFIRVG